MLPPPPSLLALVLSSTIHLLRCHGRWSHIPKMSRVLTFYFEHLPVPLMTTPYLLTPFLFFFSTTQTLLSSEDKLLLYVAPNISPFLFQSLKRVRFIFFLTLNITPEVEWSQLVRIEPSLQLSSINVLFSRAFYSC